MRFYHIALFLFIFQLVSAWTVASGFLTSLGISAQLSIHDIDEAELAQAEERFSESVTSGEITNQDPISALLGWGAQMILGVLNTVLNPLKQFVLAFPYILIQAGVQPAFAYLMGTIFWLIQIIGFAEFATGRRIDK